MKKLAILQLIVIGIVLYIMHSDKKNDSVKIGICKVIEHEAINSVVSGIKDYLKQQKTDYQLSFDTCQGNMAIASQIVAKFANSDFDIVVTVGTTPTQCAYNLAKDKKIKLVFSSVTNPDDISVNLKDSNTTGVSNFVALEPQIALFKKLQPSLKVLGIIYNTGEQNSFSIVKRLREVCVKNEIILEEQGISRITDIPQAITKLSESVDAIFISNDNLALIGISNIIKMCNSKKIPVYVSDTDQVKKGCLAALGPNQYDIGMQTGKMIKRILDGENINNIPVEYPKTSELYLNIKAAKLLGITVPDNIKSNAKKIIDE